MGPYKNTTIQVPSTTSVEEDIWYTVVHLHNVYLQTAFINLKNPCRILSVYVLCFALIHPYKYSIDVVLMCIKMGQLICIFLIRLPRVVCKICACYPALCCRITVEKRNTHIIIMYSYHQRFPIVLKALRRLGWVLYVITSLKEMYSFSSCFNLLVTHMHFRKIKLGGKIFQNNRSIFFPK